MIFHFKFMDFLNSNRHLYTILVYAGLNADLSDIKDLSHQQFPSWQQVQSLQTYQLEYQSSRIP
jgi:hypothetical protein